VLLFTQRNVSASFFVPFVRLGKIICRLRRSAYVFMPMQRVGQQAPPIL
jgi:hypothetical protein